MLHFLSLTGFDIESSSLESEDDNVFFLVWDSPIVHTLSPIDIDLDILPQEHEERKPPHRFREATRVFTRCTSTAHMTTSTAILIFETQTGENTSILPSSDTTTDSNSISNNDLPITLRKGKQTCTSHFISYFLSYSDLSTFFMPLFLRWTHISFSSLYQKPHLSKIERML